MNVPGLRVAGIVCLALWLGAAAFFSFIMAPAAFRALPREEAGRFLGGIFPYYYATGLGLALAALGTVWLDRRAGALGPRADLRLWAHVALVALQFGGIGTMLWIRTIKAAMIAGSDPALSARFGLAHGLSMILNLFSLLAGLAALFLSAG